MDDPGEIALWHVTCLSVRDGDYALLRKPVEMPDMIGFVRAPVDRPEGRNAQCGTYAAGMCRAMQVNGIEILCVPNQIGKLFGL